MDNIFSYFVSRGKEDDTQRVGYLMWFNDSFPESEFTSDDLVMKKYCDYCSYLGVPMKYDYFTVFLQTELKKILIDTGVRVPGTDNLHYDDPAGLATAYTVSVEYLVNEFRVLESYEGAVEDFKVAASEFIDARLKQRLTGELSKTFEVLSNSDNSITSLDYALDNMILLRDIYDKSILEDIAEGHAEGKDFVFVCDTGIPVIDNDISGIYTCQVYGLEAQPGTGKTRFAIGVWAYRAAVVYKKNVIYYQLEQTKTEAEAMFTARHVFTLYGIQISSGDIQFNRVPDEYGDMVEAAKIDLFESGKYGKIYINKTDLYYDTLQQTFRKDDKLHGPFDMIVIDYAGLIEQKPTKFKREMQEYEVISKSYKSVKRYVERTRKCAIMVAQFNQKGIDAGKADKEITTDMAQGGINVYRHTDQNLALSCTTIMKAQMKIRVSQPKIRGTAGFGTAVIDTRLGFCYFYQNVRQEL